MSSEATTWALAQKAGNASAKAALLALAGYADEHGRCWPSLQRLADNSEQSRKTIWRQLRHLEAIGLIDIFTRARENGSNTTCEYRAEGLQQRHRFWPRFDALLRWAWAMVILTTPSMVRMTWGRCHW
ncbi:helix-turn-helix domain-containing protein [Ancylobacter dichloromethanicus]